MNPSAEVRLHHKAGETALFVLGLRDDDSVVWLESISDIDPTTEIFAWQDRVTRGEITSEEMFNKLEELGFKRDFVSNTLKKQ
jgi:hypothetical protein